jgi:hypothetical protein
LINDLLPFTDYLTSEQSEITSLRDLERSHIEGFLVWNRTRAGARNALPPESDVASLQRLPSRRC